jgi:hypothetical protein
MLPVPAPDALASVRCAINWTRTGWDGPLRPTCDATANLLWLNVWCRIRRTRGIVTR